MQKGFIKIKNLINENKWIKSIIIILVIALFPLAIMFWISSLIYKSKLQKNYKYAIITILLLLGISITFGMYSLQLETQKKSETSKANDVKQAQVENKTETGQEKSKLEKKKEGTKQELYTVEKVIDGDTIKVNMNGKSETIRLIGIDAPETVDPRKPVQCFGKEASDKARELLTGGKVMLEADPTQGERDKYGRLLRYIFLEDGTHFNKWMIKNGYAYEYTYNLPYKYQDEFKQAEKLASDNDRGLWNPNTCNRK